MGLFSKNSQKDAAERLSFAATYSGFIAEALQNAKKNKISTEDLRRELARHDSQFRYVDSQDLKRSLNKP